jgi:hypothetical protein
MNRYLKLVNFEVNRFVKVYIALLGITVISQFIAVLTKSKGYVKDANQLMIEQSMTISEYTGQYGKLLFSDIMNTLWFIAPIAISAAALIFYIFLIWYRDWFGKNTFIYRLLMLPTSRLNIISAKATAILLMVFGLVALQIVLLPLENYLFQMLVPVDLRDVLPIKNLISSNQILIFIIPNTFIQFLLYYGLGMMILFILFTGILFERSYRLKGVVFAILYFIASMAIFLTPPFLSENSSNSLSLYPAELLAAQVTLGIIISALSLWVSNFLINKRVTV